MGHRAEEALVAENRRIARTASALRPQVAYASSEQRFPTLNFDDTQSC